jgi:hypothetical protein
MNFNVAFMIFYVLNSFILLIVNLYLEKYCLVIKLYELIS